MRLCIKAQSSKIDDDCYVIFTRYQRVGKNKVTEKFMFEAVEERGRCVLLPLHAVGTFTSQHGLCQLLTTTYNITPPDITAAAQQHLSTGRQEDERL